MHIRSSRAGEHGALANIKGWLIFRAAQVIWTQYFLRHGLGNVIRYFNDINGIDVILNRVVGWTVL